MRKIVIVADLFANQYAGGAELSTEALIEVAPQDYEIIRLESSDVNRTKIDELTEAFWIFTNFTKMGYYLIPQIVKQLDYIVVEYDYKLCWYRSPDLHVLEMEETCKCENAFVADLFINARACVFMSEKQAAWYKMMIPAISEKSTVLGSFFSDESLRQLIELRAAPKGQFWAVIASPSKIKGYDAMMMYCGANNIEPKILKDLLYSELLRELSTCKGLIYKPIGGDTCPRTVIEAQMMGLELDLNDFVQHKDEGHYSNLGWLEHHLKFNKHDFWKRVVANVIHQQKVNV